MAMSGHKTFSTPQDLHLLAVQAPAPAPGVTTATQNVSSGQPASAQASGASSNMGAIIGGVVGGVALLVLVALVAACVVQRRRRTACTDQKLSHYHEYDGKDGVLGLEVCPGPHAETDKTSRLRLSWLRLGCLHGKGTHRDACVHAYGFRPQPATGVHLLVWNLPSQSCCRCSCTGASCYDLRQDREDRARLCYIPCLLAPENHAPQAGNSKAVDATSSGYFTSGSSVGW